MINDLNISGNNNIGIQNVSHSEINLTQVLGKSSDYNDLLSQLKKEEKYFARLGEDEMEERLETSAEIEALKKRIEDFKQDVLKLAQAFQRIEINTERKKRAKEYFDKGEFKEARAVLDFKQLKDEQERILARSDEIEKERQEILQQRRNNAEEFHLKALATLVDYENPNRFEETCSYFEHSIKSHITKDNLFGYAKFLQEYNQPRKAIDYYNQYLNEFAGKLLHEEKIQAFQGLGSSYTDLNDYKKALDEFNKAREIYLNLDEDKQSEYLWEITLLLNNLANLFYYQKEYEEAAFNFKIVLDNYRSCPKDDAEVLCYIALTLDNLANVHSEQEKYKEKALEEYKEALEIRKDLVEKNSQKYLPELAVSYNNLGVYYSEQEEYEKAASEHEKALEIRTGLAKNSPQLYLANLATTLNNLANTYDALKKSKKASKQYEKALKIYRSLYKQVPETYTPYLAMTLINLAIYYQKSLPQREKSFEYVIEAIILLEPLYDTVPYTQTYLERAARVLRNWDLSNEEILRLVDEKKEQTEKDKA
jgi:tetratricopeptide (TPR) repeat protein